MFILPLKRQKLVFLDRPGEKWSCCVSPSQLQAGSLTFRVFVTQCCFPHVAQAQGAFAATIDKQVTVVGVKLGRCDHLRQILHVGRLDVHDVWRELSLRKTTKAQCPIVCTLPAGVWNAVCTTDFIYHFCCSLTLWETNEAAFKSQWKPPQVSVKNQV